MDTDKTLKHVENRICIRANLEAKNTHQFSNGLVIRRERNYNELNKRITQPVNAFVVSGDGVPEGTEILVHHNALDPNYEVLNYQPLSGEEIASDWRYYSIPVDMGYLYREGTEWLPLPGWATALRVFKPYEGVIQNIPPTQLKDILYITKGDYEGKVVQTITFADYEVIYQDTTGREGRKIRLRPNGCERTKHEEEVIMIYDNLTQQVKEGKLLVGLTPSDAKTLNELGCVK